MILFITSIMMMITLLPNASVGFLTEKGSHLSSLADEDTLPSPHIIVLGASGTDKSLLANVLLGEDVSCGDCTFPICDGNNSCTEDIRYGIGQWIGVGENFTIVDTPAFHGSDNDDGALIIAMIDAFKNVIQTSKGLLLTFRGDHNGFDSNIYLMIQEMESAFGRGFWNHVLLQFTHWPYDANSVADRNRTGKNEEWKTWTINEALQERFQLDFNLSAVFIDPFAKLEFNLHDEDQQVAFNREAYKAWEMIDELCAFDFKTIEDFKADLSDCRNEVLYLNDIIEKNITKNKNDISENKNDITENKNDITKNKNDISEFSENKNDITQNKNDITENRNDITKNKNDISENKNDITENKNDITENKNDITKNKNDISENKNDITENKNDITENKADITHLQEINLPVGSIIAWAGEDESSVSIPRGWQNCDGSLIKEGPMAGKHTPDLNGQGRFLRGGHGNLMTMQEDQVHEHQHGVTVDVSIHDPGHSHTDRGHTHAYDDRYNVREISDDADDRWVGSDSLTSSRHSTFTGHADISKERTSITATGSGRISGVTGAHTGSETRPKNMIVQWIIKIITN